MEGLEVRRILAQNKVNLSWLSEQLGISPQALQSRLNAKNVKRGYLLEMVNALNQDIFGVVGETDRQDSRQPIYDVRISAGYGIDIKEGEESVTEYVTIPSLKGCIGVTVYGDSMYPMYRSSDVVFVRKISDKTDIDYGSAYIIITRSDRLIKLLYPSSRGDGYIRLCSYNATLKPDGERLYPDRDVPYDNIIYIYKVVGSLHRDQL